MSRSKDKELKTNAIRILDKNKIKYEALAYDSNEFMDGITVAGKINKPLKMVYKTLVTTGKSGTYYVFVIPVDKELSLIKAAISVGEKSIQMLNVKDITSVTAYVRGGCSPIGMKKLYKTIIDKSGEELDEIIVSAGRLGLQVLLTPLDLANIINAEFCDIVLD